ncbi:CobD/CbiB family cobalamin biosynthesis protein [Halobacteriales archaeon Cl-PHB]
MTVPPLALAGGLLFDLVLAEPPNRFHPVAWLGRVVAPLDRAWTRPRLVGAGIALALPLAVAVVGGGLVWLAGLAAVPVALLLGAVVVFVTTSVRSLLTTVGTVGRRAGTDLPSAREELLALAGRDASDLSAGEVRSAALESLAENFVDGLVAPLWWFVVGVLLAGLLGGGQTAVLAAGAGGAAWVKAVNTLDSMFGYPGKSWGTASARLDDAAMWLPARLGAGLLALVFASPGSLRRAGAWTPAVASPNSGWPMGVLAAGLDVRLLKPGHYDLNPDATLPAEADVDRALRRVGLAALLAYGLAGVVTWY